MKTIKYIDAKQIRSICVLDKRVSEGYSYLSKSSLFYKSGFWCHGRWIPELPEEYFMADGIVYEKPKYMVEMRDSLFVSHFDTFEEADEEAEKLSKIHGFIKI